jgi:hypothetical protein
MSNFFAALISIPCYSVIASEACRGAKRKRAHHLETTLPIDGGHGANAPLSTLQASFLAMTVLNHFFP